ncbi:MAG: hypothetical protein ACRDL5_06610, partial [Solirubrobacteraceae bacterium]
PLRLAIDDTASGRLAASEREFDLARELRPWDPAVSATAAHAYATLAADGIAAAVAPGMRWATRELDAFPRNVQALTDAATLELAAGHAPAGRSLLARALALEPRNPVLQHLWLASLAH